MSTKKDDLLNLLNSRLSLSRRFHEKKHKKEVEAALEDYNIESFDKKELGDLHNRLHIPYIFSTVESTMPAVFSEMPNLKIGQGGKNDQGVTDFVNKVWDYIERVSDIKEVIEDAGFMYILTGLGSASFDWEYETETIEEVIEEPVTNEFGETVLNENGEEQFIEKKQSYEVPVVNKPYFKYLPYNNFYVSPESRFTTFDWDNDKIPYVIYKESLDVDEVEFIYNVSDIEADEDFDISVVDDKLSMNEQLLSKAGIQKTDVEKVAVYYYFGRLPKKVAPKDWRPRNVYKVVFTSTKILVEPELKEHKQCSLIGNYGTPEQFYRFGEAKAIRELEQDISYGRSIMSDYRDRLTTKVAISEGTEVDEEAFKSPRTFQFVKFIGDKYPQYITPPPVPEVVLSNIQLSKEEVQMASGQFDLSRGSTQSVVDTATGQKIFSESYERRIDRKRDKLSEFLKSIAINILPMAAQNWDVEKFAKITDMEAEEIIERGYIESLMELKEHYDVVIETDIYGSQGESRKSQALAMWKEMQENPKVNQEELLRNVFKIGFEEKDVERFLSGEMSPEELIKAIEYMTSVGLLDEQMAEQMMQMIFQAQQESTGGDRSGVGGRPAVQDPVSIVEDSMQGTDETQIEAQNDAAYKQSGVAKGPQGV